MGKTRLEALSDEAGGRYPGYLSFTIRSTLARVGFTDAAFCLS